VRKTRNIYSIKKKHQLSPEENESK